MITNNKTIEFQKTNNAPNPLQQNTQISEKPRYEDYTYREGYAELQLKFQQKITWLRFLPAIKGTQYEWILPFNVYKAPEGQTHPTFVDPKSFEKPCVWDYAQNWFRKNAPEQLQKRDVNPHGFKLRSTPRGLAWVLVSGNESGNILKLLNVSTYDGSYGGTTGLGHSIKQEAFLRDNEPGSPTAGELIHGDITEPEKGKLVCIEKSIPETGDTKYASYTARIGKSDAPLSDLYEKLTDEEVDKLTILENVIRIPSEDEQKHYLRQYIGDSWYNKIFPRE
jgi:hypothetical protein